MGKLAVFFFSVMLSVSAFADVKETFRGKVINAQVASADYSSAWFDTASALNVSFHCIWASLTGTLDGQFLVDVSNDAGVTAAAKSGATLTVSGASSDDVISLNGVVTEQKYRIRWVHNNVSGGTVTCHASAKG